MPKLLTIDQAAAALGVSRRTVYRWLSDGTLAAVEHEGSRRIAAEQLDRVAPPTRQRTPATTGDVRRHVLEAATAVVGRDSPGGLTIEHVAATAGMSVGGVTYHFPSKAALLDGLVGLFLDQFEQQWSHAQTTGLGAADAYVTVSLAGPSEQRTRAVLLAALEHPDIVRTIDRRVKHWYRRIVRDSPTPDSDLQRCLAADAIWLFGLLGLRPVTQARATAVVHIDH